MALTWILIFISAGYFHAASKFLLSLRDDVNNWESQVTLLRFLADDGEAPLAIKHIKGIKESFPTMLKPISSELFGSLSSAPNPNPIRQLLHAIQDVCPDSIGNHANW